MSDSRPTADIPAMPDFSQEETQAPAAPQAAPVARAESAPAEYGWFDAESRGRLAESTQGFVQKLGAFLGQALDDALTLDVRTYVSPDIGSVTYDREKNELKGDVHLRAMTCVKIDGDTLVCVPENDGELDTAVWTVHTDMVNQARESRAELLKAVISTAGSLASVFTPKA
ncbi:MAG: hypothetical protein ACOY0R_07565 [Chloroflexota bacterium]|jgi:hypothetical protein